MLPGALVQLVRKIQKIKCETQTIELKAASKGCPTRLYDTLSGFSNQDEGGVILFGIDEKADYSIVGVYDAQDLQHKVNEQCKQMEPIVRPLFTVCEIEEKLVVSVEIPSVDISERPVYYKGVGRVKGSYIRVGEADEPMSEYEIYSYDAYRRRTQDDLRVVERAKREFFDAERMDEYLRAVKKERKNLAEKVSDDQILELMGITLDGVPTLAGILIFAIYPQGFFPQLCITAVNIPGTQMGEIGDDVERFIDNQRITGSIPEMLEAAVDFVRRNSRTKTIIDESGKRRDKTEYPFRAVREVVLNALLHRDYSLHTQNTPIRIEMYRDRMEVKNSGGLYGKIAISSLGKVHPDTRNVALANALELLGIAENRYSGIPTIRHECEIAGLPEPTFEAIRGEFKVTLRNNIFTPDNANVPNIHKHILDYCETPRSRAELTALTGYSRNHTLSVLVKELLDLGLLKLTLPEKPKSSKQRYVRA